MSLWRLYWCVPDKFQLTTPSCGDPQGGIGSSFAAALQSGDSDPGELMWEYHSSGVWWHGSAGFLPCPQISREHSFCHFHRALFPSWCFFFHSCNAATCTSLRKPPSHESFNTIVPWNHPQWIFFSVSAFVKTQTQAPPVKECRPPPLCHPVDHVSTRGFHWQGTHVLLGGAWGC